MPHLKDVALNVGLLFFGLHLNDETSGYFCLSGKLQISFKKVGIKSVLKVLSKFQRLFWLTKKDVIKLFLVTLSCIFLLILNGNMKLKLDLFEE